MNNRSVSASTLAIAGHALLVTSDANLARQLKLGLGNFAISAEICSESAIAGNLVNTRKFEAIVVDLTTGQLPFAVGFLEKVRQSPSNHHSVTFAIADPDVEVRVKSNFLLQKPLTEDGLATALKAALDLITRDYRRYFRCPFVIPVKLARDGSSDVSCQTLNISEGGVALTAPVTLEPDSHVRLLFTLPEDPIPLSLDAKVRWCDPQNRAGLEFEAMLPQDLQRLQTWLARTIESASGVCGAFTQ